jgi:hypothetical protein
MSQIAPQPAQPSLDPPRPTFDWPCPAWALPLRPNPQEIDFHGLKALLHTYLDGEQYDGSGLADTIIAQVRAGVGGCTAARGRPACGAGACFLYCRHPSPRAAAGATVPRAEGQGLPPGRAGCCQHKQAPGVAGPTNRLPWSVPDAVRLPNVVSLARHPMRPVKSTVGTVVKSGEDDDPIAVMTALSTRRYAGRPFMGQVRDYVLRKCGDEELRRRFQEVRLAGTGRTRMPSEGPRRTGRPEDVSTRGSRACRASTAAARVAAERRRHVRRLTPGPCAHTRAQAWAAEGTALLINERLINSPPQLAPPLVQALFDEIQWATEDEPTQVCECEGGTV